MKCLLQLLIISLISISCDGILTQKKSSEEFLHEELKTINWNDVDIYPLFVGCNESDPKDVQKNCFENFIHNHINKMLHQEVLISTAPISDVLEITLQITAQSHVNVMEIKGDTITFQTFPELRMLLVESLQSLPQATPAIKRGIPVNAQFILPLEIKTE